MKFLKFLITLCSLQLQLSAISTDQIQQVELMAESQENSYLKNIITGSNNLAFKLLQKNSSVEENRLFSPYLITLQLSMICQGLETQVQKKMQNLTGFACQISPLLKAINTYLNVNIPAKNFNLSLLSTIWINNNINIAPAFKYALQKNFNSKLNYLTPSKISQSINNINQWISQNSPAHHKALLNYTEIIEQTDYLSFSSFNLQAPWENAFNYQQTEKGSFLYAGRSYQTSFMTTINNYAFFQDEELTFIELPFTVSNAGRQLTMSIIMPANNLTSYITNLRLNKWYELLSKTKMSLIKLQLPSFRVNYKLKLNEVIQQEGIKNIISNDSLEYSALHFAGIKINEGGSELPIPFISANAKQNVNKQAVKIDKPFIYIIYDQSTNLILAIGTIYIP